MKAVDWIRRLTPERGHAGHSSPTRSRGDLNASSRLTAVLKDGGERGAR